MKICRSKQLDGYQDMYDSTQSKKLADDDDDWHMAKELNMSAQFYPHKTLLLHDYLPF